MNQDVKRFFDAAPKDRKPLVMELHELILSMYPEAEPVLWYCMPTCRANKGWVAVGYWKGGVTVYSESFECVAAFKAANPGCNTGKGSIQFKAGEKLPLAQLKDFIKRVMEKPKWARPRPASASLSPAPPSSTLTSACAASSMSCMGRGWGLRDDAKHYQHKKQLFNSVTFHELVASSTVIERVP